MAEIGRGIIGRNRAVAEVLSGAETAPGSGQENGANGVVGFDHVERGTDLFVHPDVETVEPVGPVERDRRKTVLAGIFDRFEGHSEAFRISVWRIDRG